MATHAHQLAAPQQGHDARRGRLVEAQPLGQLVQREAFALAHVDEHPELLRGETVAAEPMPDRLLDPPPGGPDQETDGLLFRQ